MEEFKEIALPGWRLTFNANGQPKFSFSHPLPVSFYLLAVSFNGDTYGLINNVGLGRGLQVPSPSIVVYMVSDSYKMYGRKCPRCEAYHRTTAVADKLYCPYCNHYASIDEFITDNQREYIKAYVDTFLESRTAGKEIEIDLDEIIIGLKDNTHKFIYTENSQQNQYVCDNCQNISRDVLGEYSGCPACGKRNSCDILSAKLCEIQAQQDSADQNLILYNAVAHFDGMGSDILELLQYISDNPKRKKEISRLKLQSIEKASKCLSEWFRINIFKDLTEGDKEFIFLMFNRRHLIGHKGGKVDTQYLRRTNDPTVKKGQTIRINSQDNARLFRLLNIMANNLVSGWESIS